MNRWLLLALIACCAAALAQQSQPVTGEGAPQETAAADAQEDMAATPADDKAGEPDEEFIPSEEITEDYPVPLPSDI